MRENPYRLAEDVSGIGFRIADEIAAKVGIHTDSDYRIRSGLLYTLQQAGVEGHCYLPAEKLLIRAEELLGVKAALMEPQLANLAMDKKLVVKTAPVTDAPMQSACAPERRVYASSFYYAELACARMLHDLNVREDILPAEEEALLKKIALLEEDLSISLDELQRRSVLESIRNGIFILSGGPEQARQLPSMRSSAIFFLRGWISC